MKTKHPLLVGFILGVVAYYAWIHYLAGHVGMPTAPPPTTAQAGKAARKGGGARGAGQDTGPGGP